MRTPKQENMRDKDVFNIKYNSVRARIAGTVQ